MKITHVTTRVLSTPADNPLVVGLPAPNDTREFVTLELGTDQGLVGVGLTFFGGALTPALKVAVDALAELADRRRSDAGRGDRRQAAAAASGAGPGGIFTLALSRHRHGVLGPQGQGRRPVRLRAAGRPARPRADVRQRRADAAALRSTTWPRPGRVWSTWASAR